MFEVTQIFNVIDLVAVLLILIGALIAFKRGFVKTFFGFISTFLAIVLAFVFCNLVASWMQDKTQVDEWLEEKILETIDNRSEQELENEEKANKAEDNDRSMIAQFLTDLPESIQDTVSMEEYKANAKKAIAEKAVGIIIKILAWIGIYLVARIVLFILCLVFDGIMSIPFLKQINNVAGLILGIILGFIRVYVILAFISFLVSITQMDSLVNLINQSVLVSAMYHNNLLLKLIF